MEQGTKEVRVKTPVSNNLDPYHQLVELQKQMIQLAEQNERVRQECAELRERVTAGVVARRTARPSLRPPAKPALSTFQRMVADKASMVVRIIKEPSKC